jgi:CspA family cold shock protein
MGRGGPNIGKRPDKIVRESAPPPQEPFFTQDTTTGTVKWWDGMRGYGAIETQKTGPWDIWCSFGHIDAAGYRALAPGQRVEVQFMRLDQDSFKYVATRVRPIDRAHAGSDESG